MSNIFRAYDIRGLYPKEINEQIAEYIGNLLVQFLEPQTVVVGEDIRNGSPELSAAVISGITKAGSDVIYIGQCTTPLFYFAAKSLNADAGIMVTASHNPAEYNGLKITDRSSPMGIDNGLGDLRDLFEAKKAMRTAPVPGQIEENFNVRDKYLEFLEKAAGVEPSEIKGKAIIDMGNSVAALTVKPLMDELNIQYQPINLNIDSNFSGRGPDPAADIAVAKLREAVLESGADIGLAFDGDADRLAVVDEKGEMIEPQYILALLWEELGRSKTVFDLRFSKSVKQFMGSAGVESRVGHTFISSTMQNMGAELGGETSGHFFFKAMNYTESSELAAVLVLKILHKSGKKLSELIAHLKKYFYSGEINIKIVSRFQFSSFSEKIKKEYPDAEINELDGLTVEYWDGVGSGNRWWFNIRASNTESVLRLVVEADTKKLLDEKILEVQEFIESNSQS